MNRRRIIIALAGSLAVGLLIWLSAPSHEPVYRGKPLSYWLVQQPQVGRAESVYQALRVAGTDAVPVIMAKLRRNNSLSGRAYDGVRAWLPMPVRGWLPDRMRRAFTYAQAEEALDQIGPASIPALYPYLRDGNFTVRCVALKVLNLFSVRGGDIQGAVPALVDLLVDPDSAVRLVAFAAIARCRPIPLQLSYGFIQSSLVPAWVRGTRTRVNGVAYSRVPSATPSEAVPVLTHLLLDTDPAVRSAAKQALKRIDSKAASVGSDSTLVKPAK